MQCVPVPGICSEVDNVQKKALMPELTEICEQTLSEVFAHIETKSQGI